MTALAVPVAPMMAFRGSTAAIHLDRAGSMAEVLPIRDLADWIVHMRKLEQTKRRGFTLIELVLVIMILAILDGLVTIVVGRLPSSTSVSTSASTVSQAVRAIQQFKTTEGHYPTRLDLLLADHTSNVLPGALGPTDTVIPAAELTVLDISGSPVIAATLKAAGITQVVESPEALNPTTGENQTMFDREEPGGAPRIVAIDASPGAVVPQHVVVLGADAIARLNLDASGSSAYVVFGLGNNCEAVGEAMVSAPVHSREEEGAVVNRYARFMPVFRVEGTTASLVTVVTLENQEGVARVTGVNDYLRTFYNNRNQSN
jgi:prepilin-type N-terminal cleavage/methylation domain-containing protein